MYSLPCPGCQTTTPVSPSQAGEQVTCPSCGATIQVPKLGDLRQLASGEENAGISPKSAQELPIGRRIGSVVLGLLAVASLVIAGFCGLRWSLLDVSMTTEEHLTEVRETYADLDAARLIREYEDMEKYGLAIAVPYTYKTDQNIKNGWGRNAVIAAIVCIACGIAAMRLAGSKQPATADT